MIEAVGPAPAGAAVYYGTAAVRNGAVDIFGSASALPSGRVRWAEFRDVM